MPTISFSGRFTIRYDDTQPRKSILRSSNILNTIQDVCDGERPRVIRRTEINSHGRWMGEPWHPETPRPESITVPAGHLVLDVDDRFDLGVCVALIDKGHIDFDYV